MHIEEICHEVSSVTNESFYVKGQYSILLYSALTTDPAVNLRAEFFSKPG